MPTAQYGNFCPVILLKMINVTFNKYRITPFIMPNMQETPLEKTQTKSRCPLCLAYPLSYSHSMQIYALQAIYKKKIDIFYI